MRTLTLMSLALLAGTVGCRDCDSMDARGAVMEAQISAPRAPIKQEITVRVEEAGDRAYRQVSFVVVGIDLRWHVRAVRLVESTGQGRVLYDIPPDLPGGDGASASSGALTDTDPAVGTWEHFLVLLETNGVVVELVTDVPGLELVRLPIRGPDATEWYTPSCPSLG